MKKWFSLMLCAVLLFTIIPLAGAQTENSSSVEQLDSKKAYVAMGKVTSVDLATSKLTLESKGMTLVLAIDANTKIRISDVKSPDLSYIWVGDKVVAEYVNENNSNTARKLSVTKQKGSLKGNVELIDVPSRTLKVAGKQLVAFEKADIQLMNVQGTFADILLGDKIEAKGFTKDGILYAYYLKITKEATEIKGKLESINPTNKSVVIDGKVLLVTDKTEIKFSTKRLKFEDLKAGSSVEAKAWKKSETEWVALEIKVKKDEDSGYEGGIEGKINEVNVVEKYITVEGKKVLITDKSVITDKRGRKVPLANLTVGMKAEARGTWKDSILTASKIKVEFED
ncbi:DUF5666 domain-containing protein [Brevibacillus sp. SYSU BS000544]|uniref:DUF5666 domain-containing protein n=1 Tax=Brevibacillus sp. SYSU BS000544 TaxID=3416443 RepID=UPI003CE499B7